MTGESTAAVSGKVDLARRVAALGMQKAFRGWKGRQRVQMILWRRYVRAAEVIQVNYRKWRDAKKVDEHVVKALPKDRKIYRASRRRPPLRQREKLKYDTDNQVPTSVLFRKVLRGAGTHADKMAIWRAIIELRRGHPYWSTHTAFKSMIESRGDLSRSLTLMADETFALKNEGDVPMQLQKLFVPSRPPPAPAPSSGATRGRAGSPITTTAAAFPSPSPVKQFQGTGLAGIRNMRTTKVASGNALDYSSLLLRNYFSKYYAMAVNVQNPCRKPMGFEPWTFGALSPRADGSVVQSWDNSIKHGMNANLYASGAPAGKASVPALSIVTGSLSPHLPPTHHHHHHHHHHQHQHHAHHHSSNASLEAPAPAGINTPRLHAQQASAAAAAAQAVAATSTPRLSTPRLSTPRQKDEELLHSLLNVQQQLDALSRK